MLNSFAITVVSKHGVTMDTELHIYFSNTSASVYINFLITLVCDTAPWLRSPEKHSHQLSEEAELFPQETILRILD